MNNGRELPGYGPEDIEGLRKSIKTGDTIRYKVMAKDRREPGLLVRKIAPVQVTGVYPHLVQAVDEKERTHTITYAEMLTDGYILNRKKEKTEKEREQCLKNSENLIPAGN